MKKFLLFAVVALLVAACTNDSIEELQHPNIGDNSVPESITVGFEENDNETRIQLKNGKTVWTKNDQVSVFYLSDANQKWQYYGETGSRTADLKCVSTGTYVEKLNKVVVVYPYSEDYYINPETCNVRAFMPAEQTYMKDSYGLDGNIMISAGEYNQFSLKNVCGWLKVQLSGNGEKIKSITLRGNNGEQVAGEIYINSADATATLASEMGNIDDEENGAGGNLVFDDTILTKVTLNCGNGVILSAEATAFYIAVPPQKFENGFTVYVEDIYGTIIEQTTTNAVLVERNHIVPMAKFEYVAPDSPSIPELANNKIIYKSSDGKVIHPNKVDVFGAKIVSNTYSNDCGVITFNGDITSIGFGAFWDCWKLIDISIPNSVVEIGQEAFRNCSRLEKIIIPNSVKKIGGYAFHICGDLTEVQMSDNIETIEGGAFSGCGNLREFKGGKVSNDHRCIVLDGRLVAFAPADITAYSIPYGITTICEDVFYSCYGLEDIFIPNTVHTIGNGAFMFSGIETLKLPEGLTYIGEYVFSSCTNLSSVTIPNSVETIRHDAFSWCENLTSISIPDSVIEIESNPFIGCENLYEFNSKYASEDKRCLIINGTLVSVAPYALIGYDIPNNVEVIGHEAFRCCDNIMSVSIPSSVVEIGAAAFDNCSKLSNVYCEASNPPMGGWIMFDGNAENRTIYVPSESVELYRAAEYWSEYADSIKEYEF